MGEHERLLAHRFYANEPESYRRVVYGPFDETLYDRELGLEELTPTERERILLVEDGPRADSLGLLPGFLSDRRPH